MSNPLQKTPLAAEHQGLGAKMVNFGGWHMPLQYTGLVEEHHAVRQKAGLFDVSHMGQLRVSGPDAISFVDRMTTNRVNRLKDTQIQYSLLTDDQGGVIDDLLIYRNSGENLLLVVNAANQGRVLAWLRDHAARFQVELTDEGPDTALIAIQGPKAQAILQQLTPTALETVAYFHFTNGRIANIPAVISRTGYTGEDGFECYLAADQAPALWRALLEAGGGQGLIPCGLGARDSLRLEARLALCGQDIDTTTTPLEAGLGVFVKLKKKADFPGKARLIQQKQQGLSRELVGFEIIDRGIARQGFAVINQQGEQIGQVTSGTYSPTLKKSIGLAYVGRGAPTEPGGQIQIKIRSKTVKARIVKGPFYKRSG